MSLNSSNGDFSWKGFVAATHAGSPRLVNLLWELIDNSLEIMRLNETGGGISIYFYTKNNIIQKIIVTDKSIGNIGIKDLNKLFKPYTHNGDKDGWSCYGIGGTEALISLGDTIKISTKCINDSIKFDILEVDVNETEYEDNLTRKILNDESGNTEFPQYHTGTIIEISSINKKYKKFSLNDFNNLIKNIPYVETPENVDIKLNLIDYSNSQNNKEFTIKDHNVITECKKNTIRKCIFRVYDKPGENLECYQELCNEKGKLELRDYFYNKDGTKPKTNSFNDNYKVKKINTSLLDKEKNENNFNSFEVTFGTHDTERFGENRNDMGFNGHHSVNGGGRSSTNNALILDWGKFSSHRNRYVKFRGLIKHSRHTDEYFNCDQKKNISDDRPFEKTINYNILNAAEKYLKDMRKMGYYNTEKKKTTTLVKESKVNLLTQTQLKNTEIAESNNPEAEEKLNTQTQPEESSEEDEVEEKLNTQTQPEESSEEDEVEEKLNTQTQPEESSEEVEVEEKLNTRTLPEELKTINKNYLTNRKVYLTTGGDKNGTEIFTYSNGKEYIKIIFGITTQPMKKRMSGGTYCKRVAPYNISLPVSKEAHDKTTTGHCKIEDELFLEISKISGVRFCEGSKEEFEISPESLPLVVGKFIEVYQKYNE